ncbi:hypothetical protein D3C73_1195450 [compost metagenome]
MLGEVGLGDQFTGMHHQVLQHLVLVAGEVDIAAGHADGLRCQIQGNRTAFQGRLAPACGAAQQRVDAGQQLFHMERLDQVIVGALLQALDLVLPARTRGQDQHRELLAFVAQGLDQLHARHLGQAKVDDADVERYFAAHVQAFFAVLRCIDGKTFALEPGCQGLTQRGFVFDQKDTHELSLVCWVRPGGLWVRVDSDNYPCSGVIAA